MSQPKGNCPNCGAPVEFQFSSAVQTVCPYCKSILVRTDVDLQKVGEVADLPPDSSPIQLRAEGIFGTRSFYVAGRILYSWEQGGWNEWHIVFNDGNSGWLSDAQAEYAISVLTPPPAPLPSVGELFPGRKFQFKDGLYQVTTVTHAKYVGVEGELPFQYWDKAECVFADLRTHDRRFGTIDYSENPPLLFLGEVVEFDQLRLKNLREFEGW